MSSDFPPCVTPSLPSTMSCPIVSYHTNANYIYCPISFAMLVQLGAWSGVRLKDTKNLVVVATTC